MKIRNQDLQAGIKVLKDVVGLETLKPRIERFHTVEEGLREQRTIQNEITLLGKYVNSNGFTPGRDFQRVATIPSSVWSAVMEVFGNEWDAADAAGKKRIFYALLAGPLKDYDTRTKPTIV